MKTTKFIDLTLDYGFKLVFANPDCPDMLLRFLNEIITDRTIVDITFLNPEVLGPDEDGKRPVYDIKCRDSEGNIFVTEMQKYSYRYFGDRIIIYSGGSIGKLLKRGEEYYAARTLYIISVMGERLVIQGEDEEEGTQLVRSATMRMDNGNVLSNKFKCLFLQISQADRPTEKSSFLEKFAWYVRTMVSYTEVPEDEKDPYFLELFEKARRSNISKDKLSIYDNMVRDEIQIKAERDYAVEVALAQGEAKGLEEGLEKGREEGLEKGLEKGKIEVAKAMKNDGLALDVISRYSGLSIEQIESL